MPSEIIGLGVMYYYSVDFSEGYIVVKKFTTAMKINNSLARNATLLLSESAFDEMIIHTTQVRALLGIYLILKLTCRSRNLHNIAPL